MTTVKTNLQTASRQWAVRPADERFWTLQELLNKTRLYKDESRVKNVALAKCQVVPVGADDLGLKGPQGSVAAFQHYSFGQLSNLCGAPAAYLRTLPAPIASSCMNHGLAAMEGEQSLMFRLNGGMYLRCVTSDRYARIWNYEIAELALALEQGEGWRTPPARPSAVRGVPVRIATREDVLRKSAHPGLGVEVGDEISPAGLYASDHDCFIFQVNEDRAIDGGNGELLYRGVFWSNSEVGAARFRATLFLYESVCGNHIVWGAKTLAEVSIRHTGEARQLFQEAMGTVTQRMLQGAAQDEQRIRAAKRYELGKTPEDIVTLVFGKNFGLSRRECEDSYKLAERFADDHGGNPRSAWGYAAGITRLSQGQYADRRDTMDRAAGKVLELCF